MNVKLIPLGTRGGREPSGYAIVDASDYDELRRHSWYLLPTGYAARNERRADGEKRLVLMHRQLLGLWPGDPLQADHVNRNRLDNRRANLRVVTASENRHNVTSRAETGLRGVHRRGNRFRARAGGKELGTFATAEEAARVAAAARAEMFTHTDPEEAVTA